MPFGALFLGITMVFDKKKRQLFLTEDDFITFADHYREYIDYWANNVGGSGDILEEKKEVSNEHSC